MVMRRELGFTPETKKPDLDRWAIKLTHKQLHDPSFDLRQYLDSLQSHTLFAKEKQTGAEPSSSIRSSFNPPYGSKTTTIDDEKRHIEIVSHLSEGIGPSVPSTISHLSRHLCTHTTQTYLFHSPNSVMIQEWRKY